MMECHLKEIVSSWVDEMVYKSSNMIAHRNQRILLQLIRVFGIWVLAERDGEISVAAQPFWHVIFINHDVVSPVSGSNEIEKLVGAEGSLATSPGPLRDIILFLADGYKRNIENLSADVLKDSESN